MKKNFRNLLAVALVAAAVGVVAPDVAKALDGKRETINWQKLDLNGEPEGEVRPGDESNPFPEDCPGTISQVCAEGTVQGETTPSHFYYYN